MSSSHNSQRKPGLFMPGDPKPFRISQSKIDVFLNCARCYFLDRVFGVAQPPGYPLTLKSAVDKLPTKEVDFHRAKHTSQPLTKAYGLNAVPFDDPRLAEWRNSQREGVSFVRQPTNLLTTAGAEDPSIHRTCELIWWVTRQLPTSMINPDRIDRTSVQRPRKRLDASI